MKNSIPTIRSLLRAAFLSAYCAAAVQGQESNVAPMPRAVVPLTSYDFGEIAKGEIISQVFTIRNLGNADLIIKDFTVDCSCEVVSVDRTIPPGQEGRATVEVNTKLFFGQILKRATLRTNDPQQPDIMVSLSANVLGNPDGTALSGVTPRQGKHIGPMFIQPYDGWKFSRSSPATSRKEFTVTVERESLQITGVTVVGPHFKAQLVTVKPGKSYKIVAEMLPGGEPSRIQDQLRVISDSALLPWFPIALIIKPDN